MDGRIGVRRHDHITYDVLVGSEVWTREVNHRRRGTKQDDSSADAVFVSLLIDFGAWLIITHQSHTNGSANPIATGTATTKPASSVSSGPPPFSS
uniref:Uncharacterized protein n=1 Tax=Ascaris lumbricoides TaxID=6252 RepID=A0A0M3HTK4_ASCLU